MFITLEGIEGAGKTSQVDPIVSFIETKGYTCVTTREPGGTPIGVQIRRLLLDPTNAALDSSAELLLYLADRIQHIKKVIAPHLAAGRVVLCDRFFDATMVYQGYARGLDRQMIVQLHQLVCDNLTPDLTLLFDLDPQLGLARAWRDIDGGGRTDHESRFEQERIDFHQKVRAGYLDLAGHEPDRFRIIDAQQSEAEVTQAIEQILEAHFLTYVPKIPS